MLRKILLFLFISPFLFISTSSHELRIPYHHKYSPQLASDITISLMDLYGKISVSKNDNILQKLFNLSTALPFHILNHELGHASRIKEYGGKVDKIKVKWFSGYVKGNINNNFTQNQLNLISLAGIASSDLLASNLLERDLLLPNSNNYQNKMVYFLSHLDQYHYINKSSSAKLEKLSNDIVSYIKKINSLIPGTELTVKKLKKITLFDLINPTLLTYPVGLPPFSFKLGKNRTWTPLCKTVLTDTGYRYEIRNYLKTSADLYSLTLGKGKTYGRQPKNTYRIKFSSNNAFLLLHTSLGYEISYWKEGVLNETNNSVELKNGGMFNIKFDIPIGNHVISCKAGYKTKGYDIGYITANGLIFGFNYKMFY